jgi:lactate dehydrogenase-like 2-hydroxyacid dehydrogenase
MLTAMQPEALLVSPRLEPLAGALAPLATLHRLWMLSQSDALSACCGNVEILVTDSLAGADTDLLDRLPRLRLVACYGAGLDAIDLAFARARGIQVTHTPGVLTDDVADLAMALILMLRRRLREADAFVRHGRWAQGPFPLAARVRGCRIGIFGLGRIGSALAARAVAFGMDVRYHGRRPHPDRPFPYYPDLATLARDVHVLAITVAETTDTRGAVDRRVLEELGPGGILVNVARGGIVDEAALVDMLASGSLGGAGLDVYANEPRVPERLRTLDNVVLLPHIGSATAETRHAMAELVIANVAAFCRGEPLPSPAP